MTSDAELIYGTCVSLGKKGAILTGASGSGKSDLALRFIFATPPELDPALIADDQVYVEARNGQLFAYPPKTISGQIEIRGLGIAHIPFRKEAEVKVLIRLTSKEEVPRLPPSPLPTQELCGINVPILLLSPFESSAALKLRLALQETIW